MKNRALPVGIENFEKIRKNDFYYVDKTNLIRDILNNWSEVNLFTRPRRFGKTLTMSMLKNFFEIGSDKSIFDGLAISNEKELCEQYMGKYPVISISLKKVEGSTFEMAYGKLRNVIREEAFRHKELRNSTAFDSNQRESFDKIYEGKDDILDIEDSLETLSRLLEMHYGQKAIILIDEYDVPLDKAYINGYYPQMIEVIRAMFGACLKTNDSLFFAVLTGGLRVSKESIFTGLNNLNVRSITDVEYDEYFGFTDEEVVKLLSDYNLSDHYDEVKKWYDGYLFGLQKVYCPWDVIKYSRDLLTNPNAKPKVYWLHTSGNETIRRLIKKTSSRTTKSEIERLIAGETITKRINEQLTHGEIDDSEDNIWSLLYMTGYLTLVKRPSGGVYTLKIPNQEVAQIFKEQVLEWFNNELAKDTDQIMKVYTAFENCDTETITDYLNKKLLTSISYYDAKESFYHGMMVSLLKVGGSWDVHSNDEAGDGRADIILEKGMNEIAIVIELKVVKDIDKLDEACQRALRQIEEKDYASDLKEHKVNKILAYGIAFCGKKCKVLVETVR